MPVLYLFNNKELRLKVPYSSTTFRADVAAAKSVPGATFVPQDKGGPFWRYKPATLATARLLREAFGDRLRLTAAVKVWGRTANAEERRFADLASTPATELVRLPSVLPGLYAAMLTRPWQIGGTAFLAASPAPLSADQPRMGKTLMEIGAVYEAGLEEGPHLVIALKSTLETVWKREIEKWTGTPAYVAGEGSRKEREAVIAAFKADAAKTKWLIINAAMVRVNQSGKPDYPSLHDIKFTTSRVDESHKAGIVDPKSLTSIGLRKLKLGKKTVMSGTMLGGKAINLWSVLNFADPKLFSSKWRWAYQWLEVEEEYVGYTERKVYKIGKLREDRRDEFFKSLNPYMLRRTRDEVRTESLAAEAPVDLWYELKGKAAKQYEKFAQDAEIRIDEVELTATSVLAEYTRLKQFSWGYHNAETIKEKTVLRPTYESPKWDAILDLLEERGIFNEDETSIVKPEQVVIFSQFKPIVDLIYEGLKTKKIAVGKITGDVNKPGERTALQDSFQAGKLRVMVMTTTAGGVGITLNSARTVIIVDETWNPDDQTQAVDRIEDMSRKHSIAVYYLRSKGTIEEQIMYNNFDKESVNKLILDLRRTISPS